MKNKSSKFILRIVLVFYLIAGVGATAVYANKVSDNKTTNNTENVQNSDLVERTDDISSEIEQVKDAVDSVTAADTKTSENSDEEISDDLDADGVGYVEIEATDIPEDAEVHTEVSGSFVGTAVVSVKGGNGLNMRKGPGKNYGIITDYKNGTELYVIDGDGTENWVHVTDGENEGYMSGKSLDVTLY